MFHQSMAIHNTALLCVVLDVTIGMIYIQVIHYFDILTVHNINKIMLCSCMSMVTSHSHVS